MPVAIWDAIDSDMPDVQMSSASYASRFANEVGQWFLEVQERTVLDMISEWLGTSVLEVGGGHGQLTGGLIRSGYRVTVLGSRPICAELIKDYVQSGDCRFEIGSVGKLPYADKSFDIVSSFRLMPHAQDWKGFISELARVARKAVVIDYAVLRSVNFLAERLFWLKRKIEKNTTGFVIYDEHEVLEHTSRIGLVLKKRFPQYFLPVSFHRLLGRAGISKRLESFFRAVGLTNYFGSPVIACFVPRPVNKSEYRKEEMTNNQITRTK